MDSKVYGETLMDAAIKDRLLNNKFKIHDLRRKAASDASKINGIEYARKLLGHTSQQMTHRYIGAADAIDPLNSPSFRQIRFY